MTTMPCGAAVTFSIRAVARVRKRAAAGGVRLADALQADDLAAGRQVGARDEAHEVVEGGVGVGDEVPGGADHLDEVVRRHVRRHPDGDPARAVDQQVRERRGQHLGLGQLVVVVRDEVDDVLVEAVGHEQRGGGHPRLGVPVGGRAVVQGSEVAVPVDQRHPQREVLREPDQRVVDRAVAVRVQLAHHVADDAAALDVGAVGPQAHVGHRVEDPALDRLQAVAGVGQRAGVDDGVGVLEERPLHLLLDVDVDDPLGVVLRRRRSRSTWPCGGSPRSSTAGWTTPRLAAILAAPGAAPGHRPAVRARPTGASSRARIERRDGARPRSCGGGPAHPRIRTVEAHPVVAARRALAGELLAPAAAEVDADRRAPLPPRRARAAAGVLGLAAPGLAPAVPRRRPPSSGGSTRSSPAPTCRPGSCRRSTTRRSAPLAAAGRPARTCSRRSPTGRAVAGIAFSHLRRRPQRGRSRADAGRAAAGGSTAPRPGTPAGGSTTSRCVGGAHRRRPRRVRRWSRPAPGPALPAGPMRTAALRGRRHRDASPSTACPSPPDAVVPVQPGAEWAAARRASRP